MKNRRNVVVAFLLVAVMCVGVGYAAMSDTINFTGKISYTADFQLVWGDVNDAESILTDVEGAGTDTFTVSVDTTEWNIGDTKSFTVPVRNTSRYAAENVAVQELTTAEVEENYTVTATIDSDTIAANTSATVTVTITMDSYPESTMENVPFTFEVYAAQKTA